MAKIDKSTSFLDFKNRKIKYIFERNIEFLKLWFFSYFSGRFFYILDRCAEVGYSWTRKKYYNYAGP